MRAFVRVYPNLRPIEQAFITFFDSYSYFGSPSPPPVSEAELLYTTAGRPVVEMYAFAASLALIIYEYEVSEGVFIEVFGQTYFWLPQYRAAFLGGCIYPGMPHVPPLVFPAPKPDPCLYADW